MQTHVQRCSECRPNFGHFSNSSSTLFAYVLTCLLLYSLKGLCKGTYTLPKQHKRRSGIRFTEVFFFFFGVVCFFVLLITWHHNVGSICGDTLQQFFISEHVAICSSMHHVCHHQSELHAIRTMCVLDIDCVCSFWLYFFCLLRCLSMRRVSYSDQDSYHVHFFLKCNQNVITKS